MGLETWRERVWGAYVVMPELWENVKKRPQKLGHLIRHLVQIVQVCIRVHVAEPRAYRLVHEEYVGELVPRAVVVFQFPARAHAIWPNFHEGTIHGAAAGAAIEPDNGAGAVGEMTVVKEPEEEVAVCFGVDLNVSRSSG